MPGLTRIRVTFHTVPSVQGLSCAAALADTIESKQNAATGTTRRIALSIFMFTLSMISVCNPGHKMRRFSTHASRAYCAVNAGIGYLLHRRWTCRSSTRAALGARDLPFAPAPNYNSDHPFAIEGLRASMQIAMSGSRVGMPGHATPG